MHRFNIDSIFFDLAENVTSNCLFIVNRPKKIASGLRYGFKKYLLFSFLFTLIKIACNFLSGYKNELVVIK
jgi:hypothetical protein